MKKETTEKPHPAKDLNKEEAKIAELTDTLKRVQAEFENYKKRCERDNQEYIKFSKTELLKKLLPIMDSFEIAIKNNTDPEKFRKGIELIYVQLTNVLKEENVTPIETINKPFDPNTQEVLLVQESEKDNIVLEELQKGYMLNEKVLRHAKVKIGKKNEPKQPASQEKNQAKS